MGAVTNPQVARRSVLLSSTGGLLLTGVGGCRASSSHQGDQTDPSDTGPRTPATASPVMSALHVHSSFSEGTGSMRAQLEEASALGVQALWWTDHDWRMSGQGYLDQLSPADLDGTEVRWTLETSTSAPGGSHRVLPASAGVNDSGHATLHLEARAGGQRRVERRLLARSERSLYSTSLHGQQWTVAVNLEERQDRAFLALDLLTSRRPASEHGSAGPYRLSYRFSDHREGLQVVDHVAEIYIRVPQGTWQDVVVQPALDLAAAWPAFDARDASCTQLSVAALAWGKGAVAGRFGEVAITRKHIRGQEPAVTQQDLMRQYAAEFPDVHQMQGVELSQETPHICWYGSRIRLPGKKDGAPVSMVPEIRRTGGVSIYAHPFGVGGGTRTRADQHSLVAKRAAELDSTRAHGCDALEVGYRQRGGADLESHQSLWDACSRSGLFLTGVGVSDNHSGMNWASQTNNFVTWLWAASTDQDELLAALVQGYAFFGDPALFAGRLDIRCGSHHMGQVLVSTGRTTQIYLMATDLPPGSELELLQFMMDGETRSSATASGVIARYPADALDSGGVEVDVSTTNDGLVRTRVRRAEGDVIALSNPLWFVKDPGSHSIPPQRLESTRAGVRRGPWS